MNEFTIEEVIAEAHKLETESFDDMPKHKFSRQHRINMKRIIALYEKNTCKLERHTYKFSFKRMIIIVCVVLLAALIATAAVIVINEFKAVQHTDNTELFVINPVGAPTEIGENLYQITDLPYGYVIEDETLSIRNHVVIYVNEASGKSFMFRQFTKEAFDVHYDSEGAYFEETEINGHSALYMEVNKNDYMSCLLLWDNGDYILEISGNLSKDELLTLAKSAEIIK